MLNSNEESQRALAYVAKIGELIPIENADFIEIATIKGWKVIVKKGLHKKGDNVVYFEIDSLLPKWDIFEPLSKTKYRIKTLKMRGVYS